MDERTEERKDEERKRSGFLLPLLSKLGLSGGEVGVGGSIGVLGTKAGLVSLLLAGTTVAAGLGLVGRALTSRRDSGGLTGALYSMLPSHPAMPGAPSGGSPAPAADGSSPSLQYLAQAVQKDASLQPAPAAEEANPAAEADAAAANASATPPPDNSNAPANVGSSPRAQLAKLPSLSGQSGGASGGSFGGGRPPEPGADRAAAANRLGGATALGRDVSAAGAGARRSLIGSRGQRAGEQLLAANRTGNSARQSSNPSMRGAGTTFDGSASSIAGPEAGVPSAGGAGIGEGARDRYVPNQSLDSKDLPQPPKPGPEKEATPYQWAIWAAVGAVGVSLLALFGLHMLKGKVEAAKATGNVAELTSLLILGKVLAGVAAAAAAAATALGMLMATAWHQTMQGLLFAGVGGLLAVQSGIKFVELMQVGPPKPDTTGKITEEKARQFADKILKAMRGGLRSYAGGGYGGYGGGMGGGGFF